MDITRVILEMIDTRVDKKFAEAASLAAKYNEKIEKEAEADNKWVNDLGTKLAKEAEEKFEKAVKAKFKDATFYDPSYRTTICFDFCSRLATNVVRPAGISIDELRKDVIEKCKQIAVENGPKTAFGEIDKYLATVDPVKALKLK